MKYVSQNQPALAFFKRNIQKKRKVFQQKRLEPRNSFSPDCFLEPLFCGGSICIISSFQKFKNKNEISTLFWITSSIWTNFFPCWALCSLMRFPQTQIVSSCGHNKIVFFSNTWHFEHEKKWVLLSIFEFPIVKNFLHCFTVCYKSMKLCFLKIKICTDREK